MMRLGVISDELGVEKQKMSARAVTLSGVEGRELDNYLKCFEIKD
jgi:hypothetical protein